MIVLSGVFGIEWTGQLANPVGARVRGGNLRQCECRNQSEYPRVQLLVHRASSFTGRSENRSDRAFRFRSGRCESSARSGATGHYCAQNRVPDTSEGEEAVKSE